jgi:hypothetical protein
MADSSFIQIINGAPRGFSIEIWHEKRGQANPPFGSAPFDPNGLDAPARSGHAEGRKSLRRSVSRRTRENDMADFTPYQQKIIKRYYNNQDSIQGQRLAEMVGELYLSTGKKREKVWASVVAAMQKLGVPQARIDHLRAQDNPALVAQVVKELEGKG